MPREGSIRSKLRSLFQKRPNPESPSHVDKKKESYFITSECLQDIGCTSSFANRENRIVEVTELVLSTRLEQTAPQALTEAVQDLLTDQDRAKRHLALNLIHAIIKSQEDELGMFREYTFQLISQQRQREDKSLCLEILVTLTKDGQNLTHIEHQIGEVLVQWLNDYTPFDEKLKFLELVNNVIKYNSAFLEEQEVMDLCRSCCTICNKAQNQDEMNLCLSILESVIKYYYLKSEILLALCMTLSRTVLLEQLAQRTWKLMRELLGTHLGHSALVTLVNIVKDRNNTEDAAVLRGSIFFIGMALWGSQRVEAIQISPLAIIPSFKLALISKNVRVAFEVSATVLRMVRKFGKSQPSILWDDVLDVLQVLHDLVQASSVRDISVISKISNNVHDILTSMEALVDNCTYNSTPDRLFNFIESCYSSRPESSVMMLLNYRAEACRPNDSKWLENLENLLVKYFRNETRTAVRLEALSVLSRIYSTNKILYEDQLLDLMLSVFSQINTDPDVQVSTQAVSMLITQAKFCTNSKFEDLVGLIKKVADKSLDLSSHISRNAFEEPTVNKDVLDAVNGLVDIFKAKLFEPRGWQTIVPITIVTTHLCDHYQKLKLSSTAGQTRRIILSLLLDLRVDSHCRVGLDGHSFSSNFYSQNCFWLSDTSSKFQSSMDSNITVFDITSVLNVINQCLSKEKDWNVLGLVLQKMPSQWANKTLILSSEPSIVEAVVLNLCNLMKEKELRRLHNPPSATFKKSDFDGLIFPVLQCMTAYSDCLHLSAKTEIIKCLEFGLISKQAPICVHTLRICCMEMETTMMKQLPSVLERLSQIAANKTMAIPLLMLLSSLVRLPKLYHNFTDEHYKIIFAIALPYTNPSFAHFAVYLAYHVIIMWFVKCRLMYRRQFVQQIIRGIQTNMKNYQTRVSTSDIHKESSADVDKVLFHHELQETCIDFLSRFTFSNCSSVPKRTPVSEFLLEGGKSQSWFLGSKLVTISTSGGGSKAGKGGLCQRCMASVTTDNVPQDQIGSRRRHRTDCAKRQPRIHSSDSFSQDDIELYRKCDPISEDTQSLQSHDSDKPSDILSALSSIGRKPFNPGQCNCWCNGWAEVYIRRPSGDTSWIMRIQNKQLFSFEDFPLSDISSLFMPSPHKSPFPSSSGSAAASQKKIESGSLEENEYIEQHDRFFKNNVISKFAARKRITLMDDEPNGSGTAPPSQAPGLESSAFHRLSPLPGPPVLQASGDHLARRSASPDIHSISAGKQAHDDVLFGSKTSAFTRQISLDNIEIDDEMPPLAKPRSQTISGTTASASVPLKSYPAKDGRGGLLPSFVFLQLYHTGALHSSNIPTAVPENNEEFIRGLKNLDRIAPYETHKVGVIYVGKGQADNEAAILANTYGSKRYLQFLKQLGTLILLKNCDPRDMFIGGLDHEQDEDGKYTYVWHDEVVQMVFHVATMMPTKDTDKKCNNKKRHIGNNYVTIVYNDSGEKYSLGTIKGQFNYVNIVIEPLDDVSHTVTVYYKEDIKPILDHVTTTRIISDAHTADLVKQISLHGSMASIIFERRKAGEMFASNWLERLRQLKRTKDKVLNARRKSELDSIVSDFTEYI